MEDREQIRLLLDVARRYHIDGMSQQAIAAEVGYSRPTISRLLGRARELGIVRIEISHVLERMDDAESALLSMFDLKQVRVLNADPSETQISAVARAAARFISDQLRPDSLLALSNGTTLSAVVEALPSGRLRDACVVQMIGSLRQGNPLIDGPDLCRRAAERLGGSYRPMPAPLIVNSPRMASALRHEEPIATALAMAAHADIALVGIGACDEAGSGHIFDGSMTPEAHQRLRAAGAVGHILAHHFDPDGGHVSTELCERTVGVSLDRLHEIPTVVGVASGKVKAAAIRGALRGGFLDVLVTDLDTALAVIEEPRG